MLRRARMHHRLSLREVERRIGRSNAYLSQVERGLIKQPNLIVLLELAELYGLSVLRRARIVLLELAELYGLNFETLASWARWVPAAPDPVGPHLRDSIVALVRQIIELDANERATVLRTAAVRRYPPGVLGGVQRNCAVEDLGVTGRPA